MGTPAFMAPEAINQEVEEPEELLPAPSKEDCTTPRRTPRSAKADVFSSFHDAAHADGIGEGRVVDGRKDVGFGDERSDKNLLDASDSTTSYLMRPLPTASDPHLMRLRSSADLWSLGIILYDMVYCVTPYQELLEQRGVARTMVAITDSRWEIPFPDR